MYAVQGKTGLSGEAEDMQLRIFFPIEENEFVIVYRVTLAVNRVLIAKNKTDVIVVATARAEST